MNFWDCSDISYMLSEKDYVISRKFSSEYNTTYTVLFFLYSQLM